MPPEPKPTPRRIKVSGKPPRGDSKSERILEHSREYARRRFPAIREADDITLLDDTGVIEVVLDNPRFKSGSTKPSSRRKKVVKEGSRKFIGPRQLRGELNEDYDARTRAFQNTPRNFKDVDKSNFVPDGTSRRDIRKFKRLKKEGPSGRKRAMEFLDRIISQYLNPHLYVDRDGRELPF